MHTPAPAPVALFLDAENVSWCDGPMLDALVTRASTHGPLLVRRAYADWAHPGMRRIEAELSRLGFDLVQVFHPVARKNSADIHMTVDVVELLGLEPTIQWFYLVTGDSDFAPLFRRLRERAKSVVGCGPRSPLSESVRASCTSYVYPEGLRASRKAPAVATPRPAVPVPVLAPPAPVPAVPVPVLAPPAPVPAVPAPVLAPPAPPVLAPPDEVDAPSLRDAYQRLLRKQGWPTVALDVLVAVHAALADEPLPFSREAGVARGVAALGEANVTAVRKAWTLLRKIGLVRCVAPATEEAARFVVVALDTADLVDRVDTHAVARIAHAAAQGLVPYELDVARALLFGGADDARVGRIEAAALLIADGRVETSAAK